MSMDLEAFGCIVESLRPLAVILSVVIVVWGCQCPISSSTLKWNSLFAAVEEVG